MIAYLRGETGADEVESRLEDESEPCMVHAINLCEVYYKAVKRSGVDAAGPQYETCGTRGWWLEKTWTKRFGAL